LANNQRRLLSVRRQVPVDRSQSYQSLWTALAAAATAGGAHAWRFVSSIDAESHLEFLEFGAGADPREAGEVRMLIDRLEAEAGASTVEEWIEER
jgi:hypothetical protein